MIRILMVDDHPIVRAGLKQILADEPDMNVTGEAQNGEELSRIIDEQKWDVCLLDISLPDKSGLEILKELKQRYPRLPILILSIYPATQFAVRVLRAGAAGYLTKESAPAELVKAIRKVLAGGKYISQALAESLASDFDVTSTKAPHETLSDREYQVLLLIASGKTVGEIAQEIHLSVKTISTYRSRILLKMNLKTNAELMYYAIQNKLVQ